MRGLEGDKVLNRKSDLGSWFCDSVAECDDERKAVGGRKVEVVGDEMAKLEVDEGCSMASPNTKPLAAAATAVPVPISYNAINVN